MLSAPSESTAADCNAAGEERGRMIDRVMLLDAVLDEREFVWLGPSGDVESGLCRSETSSVSR